MTKDTAVSLVREYSKIFKESGLSETASELSDRWPEDGSERKAMRWLGFAQGVAWHAGVFTLEELKEHSRRGHVFGKEQDNA